MKTHILSCAIGLFSVLSANAQEKVSVSALELTPAYQIYGIPQANKSVAGTPLCINKQNFTNGVGVLSKSNIKILLNKKAVSFQCLVGVNDITTDYSDKSISKVPMTDGEMVFYKVTDGNKQFVGIGNGNGQVQKGSVIFSLKGDGKELYRSGVKKQGDAPEKVSVDLRGIQVLELNVDDANDGMSGDHADWLDALITYNEIKPEIVSSDYRGEIAEMSKKTKSLLSKKLSKLPKTTLQNIRPTRDWLVDEASFAAHVYQANKKDIVLSNGLVSRVFRIYPNLATVDLQNRMTGENMLRAVSNEGTLTIDGKVYSLGGLEGQPEYAYTQYEWVDKMTAQPNSFQIVDFYVTPAQPRIKWANRRWSLAKKWHVTGKELTFVLQGPNDLKDVKVKLHYVLYDGLPAISKWFEVENKSGIDINLDEFVLEQLAMAEPESPVELKNPERFRKPNIHVESDWGFHGFIEKVADKTEYWNADARFTSQCNYPMLTPCLLEVKLPLGPDEIIASGATFKSFRTWLMPFDSDDRDRKGLFLKRLYKKIAPWTTENPIFMHCTSTRPEVMKEAVDQCDATGYEMIILSFGSGMDMEDETDENYKKFKEIRKYAESKGIEIGGYSLLSSRWISDEVDVINPKTQKRGGMIFGSSPCLCSDWGYDYFRKIKTFYEKTGMSVFENDGSYPGNVCASTVHTHHKGLKDSHWKQRQKIEDLYKWMCEKGIYTNIPDYGYLLSGGNKTGIGYREVNWSLPRERQLILGRQVLYDGLWERLPSMCWTFVPLTQYHGGGAAATLEPLNEHLDAYKAHMFQNYGTGVQAFYRGFRLYDTEKTKVVVKEMIDWYKKYRDILNSDVLHLRRPDGRDWDGIMHVNPYLKEKGFILLYNPTNETLMRTIDISLYYTGLDRQTSIREKEGVPAVYTLDRNYKVSLKVNIPAHGFTWYVVE